MIEPREIGFEDYTLNTDPPLILSKCVVCAAILSWLDEDVHRAWHVKVGS